MPSQKKTDHLGLSQHEGTECFKRKDYVGDMKAIDTAICDGSKMTEAEGTGTSIRLSLPSVLSYDANRKISFVAKNNNSGSATTVTINELMGVPLYKPNTTIAPNIVSGKAYEIWYNQPGNCFFLNASSEGNVDASDVLAGKTFSNDDSTGLVGTMNLSQLRPENIRENVTIKNIRGTLKPKSQAQLSIYTSNNNLMSIDENYNNYWGSKWINGKYEVRNKHGTLTKVVSIPTSAVAMFLACGKFGHTQKKYAHSAVIQHYNVNGTFVMEFGTGKSDNSDPYFFTGEVYVAMTTGSSSREISRWNSAGSFLGSTKLLSGISYIMNSQNYVVFCNESTTFQYVEPNGTVGSLVYPPSGAVRWINYHDFKK